MTRDALVISNSGENIYAMFKEIDEDLGGIGRVYFDIGDNEFKLLRGISPMLWEVDVDTAGSNLELQKYSLILSPDESYLITFSTSN